MSDDVVLDESLESPRPSGEVGRDTIRPPPPLPTNVSGGKESRSLQDLHSLCQRGDIPGLLALQTANPDIDYSSRDAQDVTPLHWACINAHVGVCRWLLDSGADVDAVGGDLKATPLMWAARNGHLYVVHLLLSRGADPNILDAQGFNTLQLVTHSSAVMPLLYMVSRELSNADTSFTNQLR
jgi:ankyrin repeat protein